MTTHSTPEPLCECGHADHEHVGYPISLCHRSFCSCNEYRPVAAPPVGEPDELAQSATTLKHCVEQTKLVWQTLGGLPDTGNKKHEVQLLDIYEHTINAYEELRDALKKLAALGFTPAPVSAAEDGETLRRDGMDMSDREKDWIRVIQGAIRDGVYWNDSHWWKELSRIAAAYPDELLDEPAPQEPVNVPKRVRVVKCTNRVHWWANRIGEVFDVDQVYDGESGDVWVFDGDNSYLMSIADTEPVPDAAQADGREMSERESRLVEAARKLVEHTVNPHNWKALRDALSAYPVPDAGEARE